MTKVYTRVHTLPMTNTNTAPAAHTTQARQLHDGTYAATCSCGYWEEGFFLREALAANRRHMAAAIPRCTEHPAYEADYCPGCGTAVVIGGTR